MNPFDKYNNQEDVVSIDKWLAQQRAINGQKKPTAKKTGGRGGTLTSLISEGGAVGGGLAGAAAGSVVPVVGTAIGGILGAGLGAFAGRIAENKVRDNRIGLGDAAKEGLTTAVLAGPLKAAKYAGTAGKALAGGGNTLEEALTAAAAKSSGKGLVSESANKLRTAAGDRSAAGFGVKIGATNKGQILTPKKASELTDFITNRSQQYGGIKAGTPIQQAKQAQKVHDNVIKALDEQVSAINRPLDPKEAAQVTADLSKRVTGDAGIKAAGGDVTNQFQAKIAKAKDIKDLEAIRKEADSLAFKESGGKGSTAKASEAAHTRDAIDKFVTKLSPDYKAVKGDYGLAKQALELTSKAAKDPKGLPIPFVHQGISGGTNIGGSTVAGIRNKFNAGLAGTGMPVNPAVTGAKMGAQGSLADHLLGAQGSMNAAIQPNMSSPVSTDMSNPAIDPLSQTQGDLSSQTPEPVNNNPYSKENLIKDVQRDPKNASKYIDYYKNLDEIFNPPQEKAAKLNSTQLQQANNANSGIASLGKIADTLQSNPNAAKLSSLPGGSFTSSLTGTGEYQAAVANATDVIGRLRSGGAINADEEKRFKTLLPASFDSPETANYKLNSLYSLFQSFANPQPAASSTDLASALMSSGGLQ